jgi:hypothetical protein
MKKQKKQRKAFNFLVSYYEVFNMLPSDEEKVKFIQAICEKQFFGKEIELEGMCHFAYVSQKHSIERSRKGWEDIQKKGDTEEPMIRPWQGYGKGYAKGPWQQEEEEEKEEEKEKEQEEDKEKEKLIDYAVNLMEENKIDSIKMNNYLSSLIRSQDLKNYSEIYNEIMDLK